MADEGTSDASWNALDLVAQEEQVRRQAAIKAVENGGRNPNPSRSSAPVGSVADKGADSIPRPHWPPFIPKTDEEKRKFPGFPRRSRFNNDDDFYKEVLKYYRNRRHSRHKKRKKISSSSSSNTPLGAPPPKRPRDTPPNAQIVTCKLIVTHIGNDGKPALLPKDAFKYVVRQVYQAWLKDYRAEGQVYSQVGEGIDKHYWHSGRGYFDCEVVNNISVTRAWLIKQIAKVEPIDLGQRFKGWLPEELEPLIQATVFLDNRFASSASDAEDTIFASLAVRQLDRSGMAVKSTFRTFAKHARRHTGWLVKLTMTQELAEKVKTSQKTKKFKVLTGSLVFEFADLKVAPTAAAAASTAASAASSTAKRQAELKKKAEEEAKRQAELEKKAEEEAKRKAEEVARLKAESEAKMKAEEEAKRQAELQKKAEEEAKRKAEEEAKKKAEEEAKRQAELKKKAEEEAKRKAEEEAKRQAELKKKAEEEARKKAEEEAKQKAELEAKKKAVEEAKRKAEIEAKKKAEEEAKQKVAEEAKRKADLEAKKKAEEEAARKAKLEEEKRLEMEAKKKADDLKKKAEAEAIKRAEEERKKAEELKKSQMEAEKKAKDEARKKLEEDYPDETDVSDPDLFKNSV